MKYENRLEFAQKLDSEDPLRSFRDEFFFPRLPNGEEVAYFAGNSLGLQPRKARDFISQELDDWAKLGVEGHFQAKSPWLPYHEFLANDTARIVGARPNEVVIMNSLTVNLHLMLVSFYRPTKPRHKILIEKGAFPSDRYAVVSQILFHEFHPESSLIELAPRPNERTLRTEDILETIDIEGPSLALVLLGDVNYYTGQAFDIQAITHRAHEVGAFAGFDLAHAAGNLPLHLHDWGPDFGVWCSYKYLNSGPGGPGGCFVHEKHHHKVNIPRLAGWWGNDKNSRFQMKPDHNPILTAEAWQLSNPPIFALAPLRASYELFQKATMERLREKSKKLTGYLEFLLQDQDKVEIITPSNPEERGAQLSFFVDGGGKAFHESLNQNGFICDWREPNVVRAAPVPLYSRFTDVYRLAQFIVEFRG